MNILYSILKFNDCPVFLKLIKFKLNFTNTMENFLCIVELPNFTDCLDNSNFTIYFIFIWRFSFAKKRNEQKLSCSGLFLFTQSYWETTQRGVLLLNNTSRQYSKNESNEKSFNLFSSGLQIRERYYCCPPQFLVKRMYTSAEGT